MYNSSTNQWTSVTQLTYPACCQSHVVIGCANEFMHSNESAAQTADTVQLLLFGGHSFGNDSDHNRLQRVTLGSDGLWRVENASSLSTHGILYHTATVARLPMHYLRQFD